MIYVVILLVSGVLLAFLETFIPSGGLLSVLAVAALVAATVVAFMQSPTTGCIVLIGVIVSVPLFTIMGLNFLPKTFFGRKMMLVPSKDAYQGSRTLAGVSEEDYTLLIGKTGVAVGQLRPSGIAEFDGKRYSVATQGQMIDRGRNVTVIKVEGNNIIVEAAEDSRQT